MIRIGILFLGRRRPGFDPEWGKDIEKKARSYLDSSSKYSFIESSAHNEMSLKDALTQFRDNSVDVLIGLQPTLSDGNLAASLARLWADPLILWATPMNQKGATIRTNSLVGTHIFASIMRQLKHPFEFVYGMPGQEGFDELFDKSVRLIYAAVQLKATKVGLIGYQSHGYINVQADAQCLQTILGTQLYHLEINELIDTMENILEKEVSADIEKIQSLGFPLKDIEVQDLETASKYYLALKNLMEEYCLNTLAIRCWSELPNITGQWPYLAMARLLSEETSIGCEGDVDGALTCHIGNLLNFGGGYISDWLEHDEDTITIWHTGNSVFDMLEPVESKHGPKITRHFNNNKPAVVEGTLRAGQPITIFRLWRCDNSYNLMAFDAETIKPKRHLMGTNGLAKVSGYNPYELFDDLCHSGMPHHIAVFPGHNSKEIKKFARLININWIELG